MDFNFFMPTRVISGENCVSAHGSLLSSFGRRCLILTGAHAAKASGALDDVLKVLKAGQIAYAIYSGIGENPLLSQCQEAAYAAKNAFPDGTADFMIGIGGGSVMDAAKAAAWLAANNADDGDTLMSGKLPNPPLPVVLIGTTAGTGSEVSAAAVLTIDKDGRKRSVTHPSCYARIVFADPRYTYSMSRKTTVSTALDAFAHAVEGWFAPGCGDVITSFDEKALPLIMEGLSWLAENEGLPDKDLRESLYYGSLWAGMVLNATGTEFPHPLGYLLTENYGLPHGMACAVFLPALIERAEIFVPERVARLFELCGGKDRILTILDRLTQCSVEMTGEQADAYKNRWVGNKNFTRTPGGFTPDDAAVLLRRLFVK